MKTPKKRRPMKSTEEQWRDIFAEWAASGLSDAEFCKRKNYSIDAFRYWRRRLDEPDQSSQSRPMKRTKFQIRSDAAKQRWVRDDKKEAFWRRHINAWKTSGLSKRAYCKSKNLTDSSFNAWIREIELRDRERITSANVSDLLDEAGEQPVNPFVSLHLVSSESIHEKVEVQPLGAAETRQSISLLVPGGAVINVNDCSLDFITKLYSSLKREV